MIQHKILRAASATLLATVFALSCTASFAAVPKNIKYASKGTALMGGKYYIYTVYCSDGKKRKISAWDKRKKWCTGTGKKNCSNDQLKTAKKVCK